MKIERLRNLIERERWKGSKIHGQNVDKLNYPDSTEFEFTLGSSTLIRGLWGMFQVNILPNSDELFSTFDVKYEKSTGNLDWLNHE